MVSSEKRTCFPLVTAKRTLYNNNSRTRLKLCKYKKNCSALQYMALSSPYKLTGRHHSVRNC